MSDKTHSSWNCGWWFNNTYFYLKELKMAKLFVSAFLAVLVVGASSFVNATQSTKITKTQMVDPGFPW